MARTINNMSSSITGMICHGGNKGCTMKGVVAVNAAFQSADFAMHEIFIDDIHGINGRDRITGNDRNGEDDCRYFTGKRGIESIYRVIFE